MKWNLISLYLSLAHPASDQRGLGSREQHDCHMWIREYNKLIPLSAYLISNPNIRLDVILISLWHFGGFLECVSSCSLFEWCVEETTRNICQKMRNKYSDSKYFKTCLTAKIGLRVSMLKHMFDFPDFKKINHYKFLFCSSLHDFCRQFAIWQVYTLNRWVNS